ncbi:MAG: endonuclease/exonuclease/phosphatase family protein [Actinomycetota bacterium]
MRLVVYNLKGFRLGREPIAQVLDELRPDLALLQETGPRRQLRALAGQLGMRVAADPWAFPRRRVKNAVLVRPPLELLGQRLHRFPGTERLHPRGVMVAEVRAGRRELWTLSAHLGLVPRERTKHARLLAGLASALDGPVVLGADLNELPGRTTPAVIERSLRDAWSLVGVGGGETFPSDGPSTRIDYLFVSVGVEMAGIRVGSEAGMASDHLPVIAEVEIA